MQLQFGKKDGVPTIKVFKCEIMFGSFEFLTVADEATVDRTLEVHQKHPRDRCNIGDIGEINPIFEYWKKKVPEEARERKLGIAS